MIVDGHVREDGEEGDVTDSRVGGSCIASKGDGFLDNTGDCGGEKESSGVAPGNGEGVMLEAPYVVVGGWRKVFVEDWVAMEWVRKSFSGEGEDGGNCL